MERFKFIFLFPPCIPIISHKVWIFFKSRVVVCRKHFRVCIDIYASSLSLFQQHFQVFQIMTGYENGRVVSDADIDFGNFRITISFCVGFVEESHAIHTIFADFQS